MNPSLQQEFDLLEKKKHQLLAELDQVDETKLQLAPNPEAWSILQIISHLEKIDAGTHAYIEKKLSHNPVLKKSNLLTHIKSFALHLALKIPSVKYKAPKKLIAKPTEESYSELKTKWTETRVKLEEMFEPMSEELIHAEFFKNINVGRIKILQQMSFLNLHFDRHRKQIDRTLKEVLN